SLRAVCLRPIFELVVISEIDLAHTVWLGLAIGIIRPAGKRAQGRPAIAAAGIVDESVVRQCRCRRAELERPYIRACGRILGAGRARPEHEGGNGEEGEPGPKQTRRTGLSVR